MTNATGDAGELRSSVAGGSAVPLRRPKRRMLLVSPDFPPTVVGGSVAYVHNLIEHLDAPVVILTSGRRGTEPDGLVANRHTVVRSPFLIDSRNPARMRLVIMYLYLLFGLPMRLFLRRYEVVVASSGAIGNSIVILVCRLAGVPVVAVAYAEEITMPLAGRGFAAKGKRWMLLHFYSKAEGFISVCDFTRDLLADLGVGLSKVCVIPPMVGQSKTEILERHKKDNVATGPLILSVGRLVVRKGFDRLIMAVGRLRETHPGIRLVIVGDGPERGTLENLVRKNRLDDRVTVAGKLSDEDLAPLYRDADVFVLANIGLGNGDTEGAPTVLIEASAHGIPVVAGRAGGTSTVVDDGVSGLLVEATDVAQLANAIRQIVDDSKLAQRFGEAGREKAKRDHDPATAGKRAQTFLATIASRERRSTVN